MTTYGLTTEGFVSPTFEDLRDSVNTDLRNRFGASIDLSDGSILGQIVAIVCERFALLWELGEQIYSSQDVDKAVGAALDALCLLTGTFRPAAAYSTVNLTLTGTPTTLVPSGSKAKTTSTSKEFQTTAAATITAATAWAGSTAYVVGDIRTNSSKIYYCITAGTSASSGGPTGTAADITDGTVHWRYLGEGTGQISVLARASDTGPIVALSGDINVIVTAVGGWSSVINVLDATPGSDRATDSDLRVQRDQELAAPGTSPLNSIRAAILELRSKGVVNVTMFQNVTDVTDADGMPPHSVEALVRTSLSHPTDDADLDQDIRETLLANVAAGIKTHGGVSGTATDSVGTAHTIKFSHPTEIQIYVIIDVEVDASKFPSDGATQIKNNIVTYGNALDTGVDARARRIGAAGITSVDGVMNFTSCKIGTAPAPTLETTIAVSLRQLATFDSSRITVNVSNVTP